MAMIKPQIAPELLKKDNKSLQIAQKLEENATNELQSAGSPTLENQVEERKYIIHKKREYKIFKKLIKEGKFTTAWITAQTLKLDYSTIKAWLELPEIRAAMNEEVNQYVSKIQANKQWQAQAYLLDIVRGKDQKGNLTQINNYLDSDKRGYTI